MIFQLLNSYKKVLLTPFILAGLMLIFPQSGSLNTQTDEIEYEIPPTKMVFGNVGYWKYDYGEKGKYDFSLAIGARYWFAGLSIGIAGFGKALPPYRTDTILRTDRIATTEKYTTLVVTVDASGYYDISNRVSLFGSIGFFTQKDSILARPYDINDPNLYRYKDETKLGLSIGAGFQYFLDEDFSLGLGFHTKNGFYAQVGYWW